MDSSLQYIHGVTWGSCICPGLKRFASVLDSQAPSFWRKQQAKLNIILLILAQVIYQLTPVKLPVLKAGVGGESALCYKPKKWAGSRRKRILAKPSMGLWQSSTPVGHGTHFWALFASRLLYWLRTTDTCWILKTSVCPLISDQLNQISPWAKQFCGSKDFTSNKDT